MLVNASKADIVLKWNGIEVTTKPSQKFSIAELFNLTPKEAFPLEDRFVKKCPGIVKITGPDAPYVWQEPKITEPAPEAETEGEEEAPAKEPLIDENRARKLEDHNREELETMAGALEIKFTKKTSDAKLIESIKAKQDLEADEE